MADDRVSNVEARDGPRARIRLDAAAEVERELRPVFGAHAQERGAGQDAAASPAGAASAGVGQTGESRSRLAKEAELPHPGAGLDAEERVETAPIVVEPVVGAVLGAFERRHAITRK